MRPAEFWEMTPAEVYDVVGRFFSHEKEKEKEMWRRFAFLAAAIINISGKSIKRDVKAEDLVKFADEQAEQIEVDWEKRKKEAIETLRLHKAKFWTKFKDESVKRILEEGK